MLRVLSEVAARPPPAYLATAEPVAFGDGFHGEERDGEGTFRWMGERGRLAFAPAPGERYLELAVYCAFHDLSQWLDADAGGRRERLELGHGWNPLSLAVPAGAAGVDLGASRLYPPAYYPADPRRLALSFRPAVVHADPERHAHLARQHRNAVANRREMLAGAGRLASTPPALGIDLHGVCNVKPPCVYCEWDTSKRAEGANVERPFTLATLDEYGELFANAGSLINCSIGEPFMMKELDALLDAFGDRGKFLEMTTNGQILTDRNVEKLLGRPIHLYVSLDAGTAATYARLRNDRFGKILGNLRRLIAAKGGKSGLPRVFLVFMPMRINVGELEGFVRIAADLGVDRMILRPLNYSPAIDLAWDRGGHHFAYQEQLLPFEELIEVSGRAAALAARYGVELSDQMDFGASMREMFADRFAAGYRAALEGAAGNGGAAPPAPAGSAGGAGATAVAEARDGSAGPGSATAGGGSGGTAGAAAAAVETAAAPTKAAAPTTATAVETAAAPPSLGAERLPLCHEPWKSLYILRRGVYPCCYGGDPIAPMDGYREAWNSPLLQGIRGELAAGRFHRYCLESPACPIVRKAARSGRVDLGRLDRLGRLRRAWRRLDRALGGLPRRLYRPLKPLVGRLVPALAPPAWAGAGHPTRDQPQDPQSP
jgi:molybdenum cofactor biosynthesis enzyme MoaA